MNQSLCKPVDGKVRCGHNRCIVLCRVTKIPSVSNQMKSTEFFGPSSTTFVGHYGYPNVFVGPMGMIEPKESLTDPGSWFGMDTSAIIEMRSLALRTKHPESIKSRSKLITENQLLVMSKKPTDVEMSFKKKPVYTPTFSDVTQPMGPTAQLQNLKVVDNPKIPKTVDYVVNDELKAADQINILFKKYDIYYITNILSSGAFGKTENQKLVPTRWSITATDDIAAKGLMEKIRYYPQVNQFMIYESNYLDNYFAILLMPGNWEYENFEAWWPGSNWSFDPKKVQVIEEYESYTGRIKYADKQAGGYYAARLGVCEYLDKTKKQARVIGFREIGSGYVTPVGVWQVRENVRNAFNQRPKTFADLEQAMVYLRKNLRVPMTQYLSQSKVLKQKRIFDF